MKCINCSITIPEMPEDATYEEMLFVAGNQKVKSIRVPMDMGRGPMAKCGNPKCVKERKDKEALAKACAQVLEKCWKTLREVKYELSN